MTTASRPPDIVGQARAVRVLRALAATPAGLSTPAVVEALAVAGEPRWAETNRYRVALYRCMAEGQVEIAAKIIYVGSGGPPRNVWRITDAGLRALADRYTWTQRCLRLAATELLNGAVTGEQLATRTEDAWRQLVRIAVGYGRSSCPPLDREEFEPLRPALLDSMTRPAALLRSAAKAPVRPGPRIE